MNTIGIKELHNNLRGITKAAENGQSFTVMKNAKPVFRIEPIKNLAKKYTLKDFKKLQFRGDKNLSRDIDLIVYGASR